MSAGFSLVSGQNTDSPVYKVLKIAAGQAILIGSLLERGTTSGSRVASATIDAVLGTASATTESIYAVSMGNVVSTDTTVLACLITNQQVWQADTLNASNAAHNSLRAILSTANVVNNTGTDVTGNTGIFEQSATLAAATTAGRIVGRFLPTSVS